MTKTLVFAIIAITAALIFYTIGVLSERKQGTLTKKHLLLFWLGLVCDTTGTSLMAQIAAKDPNLITSSGINLHALTGGVAILLMLFHAIWASYVIIKGTQKAKEKFHKFSAFVWTFWLIPYICGVFIGTPNIPLGNAQAFVVSIAIATCIGFILKKSDSLVK